MHSEHLTNLHPGWVVGGWLVAIAVTAAVYVGGVGLGFVPADEQALLWVSVAIAVGFFVGGMFVGLRWSEAPVLHGAAITFFSVIVWFAAALLGEPVTPDSAVIALGLVLLQLVAAVGGGWTGRKVALGGAVGE